MSPKKDSQNSENSSQELLAQSQGSNFSDTSDKFLKREIFKVKESDRMNKLEAIVKVLKDVNIEVPTIPSPVKDENVISLFGFIMPLKHSYIVRPMWKIMQHL